MAKINDLLLDGRFKIVKILGAGGMSKVYLAENTNLGTYWAIKEISKENDFKIDIKVEPNILKKLNHPSLPRIIDVFEDESYLYIVQDFIEGTPLDKELSKHIKFDVEKVIDWGIKICDVLEYLHGIKPNPVIYRDMKPANIILTPWDEIKLVDFGIAREYKYENTRDTVFIGTKGYAAPEQYGNGQSDVTTDIYSFGATIFQLLTGKMLFEVKNEDLENYGIDSKMSVVIKKSTMHDPKDRYLCVKDMRKDLEGLKNPVKKRSFWGDNFLVKERKSTNNREIYFRSINLAIWDNIEFACELAYIAAKSSGLNVLLADLDLLSPKADIILDLSKYCGKDTKSGINKAFELYEKKGLTRDQLVDICIKRNELKNLHILTGNYRIENYEYYSNEAFANLIENLKRIFEIVIIAVNRSIYDSFTAISLMKSDINVIPLKAEIASFREFNEYLFFLNQKQNMSYEKNKFVAYEYKSVSGLSDYHLNEITRGNYIGSIGYCPKREKLRNKGTPYVKQMDKKISMEYSALLKKLKILTGGD